MPDLGGRVRGNRIQRGGKRKSITVANNKSKDKGSHGDPSSAHISKEGKKKGKEVKAVKDVRRNPL